MTIYATGLANNVDTAARVRMAEALTLPVGGNPLTSKSALRADGGGAVAVVAGTMNVTVSPFAAWIQGGVSVTQGGYPFVSDATETLTLAAGHASLTRTDTIAAVIRDNTYDGSGSTDARLLVIQGTPGAGAPNLPTTAVALRDVVVPAGLSTGNGGLQAANLGTDRRVFLPGAVNHIAVGSQLTAPGSTAPSNPIGLKMVTGRYADTLNSAALGTIAFPAGTFSTAILAFEMTMISGAANPPVVNAGGIRLASADIYVPGAASTAVVISWLAIGY